MATRPMEGAGVHELTDVPRSFAQWYEQLWWPMLRLAAGIMGGRAAAEDVVQDAFAAVYRRWDDIEPDRIAGYVRTCVVNSARTAHRRSGRARRHLWLAVDRSAGFADEDVVRAGDRDQLHAAIAQLPLRQREVLVLRYVSELSESEICEATGLSPGGVRSASSRGLAALRRLMGELL